MKRYIDFRKNKSNIVGMCNLIWSFRFTNRTEFISFYGVVHRCKLFSIRVKRFKKSEQSIYGLYIYDDLFDTSFNGYNQFI